MGEFNNITVKDIRLLEFAAKYGKVTVALYGDAYIKQKYKAEATSLLDRFYLLESLKYVNAVTYFNDESPAILISQLKPSYYIQEREIDESLKSTLRECRSVILAYQESPQESLLIGSLIGKTSGAGRFL